MRNDGLYPGLYPGHVNGLDDQHTLLGLAGGHYGDTRSTIAPLRGLLAYYKLDGASTDSFYSALNGTDANITYSAGNGKIIQGAGFNGTTSKITLAKNNTKLNSFGKGPLTISFWFKTSSTTQEGMVMDSTNNLATSTGFFIDYRGDLSTDALDIRFYQSGVADQLQPTKLMSGAVWNFVTITRDGFWIKCYINSVLNVFKKDNLRYIDNANNLVIGGAGTTIWLNGQLDEIGFWNRALSQLEIIFIYKNTFGVQYPFNM